MVGRCRECDLVLDEDETSESQDSWKRWGSSGDVWRLSVGNVGGRIGSCYRSEFRIVLVLYALPPLAEELIPPSKGGQRSTMGVSIRYNTCYTPHSPSLELKDRLELTSNPVDTQSSAS